MPGVRESLSTTSALMRQRTQSESPTPCRVFAVSAETLENAPPSVNCISEMPTTALRRPVGHSAGREGITRSIKNSGACGASARRSIRVRGNSSIHFYIVPACWVGTTASTNRCPSGAVNTAVDHIDCAGVAACIVFLTGSLSKLHESETRRKW